MLSSDIIAELKNIYAQLEQDVFFKVYSCTHPQAHELSEMLEALIQTSPHLKIQKSPEISEVPRFELVQHGKTTGISFRGIPGGHEFSSLVLAVLYLDGKGKRPDDGIIARIKNLKGSIRLTTYISLSCENCPEVVQALNLMATLHSDFRHEMVDGAFVPNEVENLGIQGVPSVVSDGKLIHSGKIELIDLLAQLESHFGKADATLQIKDLGHFDVAIVGGGPAGASAAIYTARKGLRTVVISEKFGGQLRDTKGIENLISVPQTEGLLLTEQLLKHLSVYPIKLLDHRRVSSIQSNSEKSKRVILEGGESLEASAVIIATGAKWRTLGIPGEAEYIGRGVAFCAHCDGPYFKGKKIAVVGGGNSGIEAAIDLAALVAEVVVIEYQDKLKADEVLIKKLKSLPNVSTVLNAKTTQVLGDGKKVVGLEYENRADQKKHSVSLDGIFVQIGLLPNTQFVKDILELTRFGEIVVDEKGRTSKPGIYAAGDVTTMPFKQIVTAIGDGAKVALAAFEDRMRAV